MSALTLRQPNILVAATAGLLVCGFALKALRYGGERLDDPAMSMQIIEQMVVPHGWSRINNETFPEGMPLHAAVFSKGGCPVTAVTLLGTKPELKRYVMDRRGGDIVFIESNRRHDNGDGGSAVSEKLTRLRDRIFGGVNDKPLPLLALSPAARNTDCLFPLGR